MQVQHNGSRKTFWISTTPNCLSILLLLQPFLLHLLKLCDKAQDISAWCEQKWAVGSVRCWPDLFWKQNTWHLPYCCLIGGSEFCPCIWKGTDFCPPRYLQYRAWIFARNFTRSGSNHSCRKMDNFTAELIVSYSFPLIYSLTQAHTLMLKVTCVLWPAQKVIPAHSPVAVLTLMFTLYVVNIITKQILIASFLILFLFRECVKWSSHCCEGSLPLLNWP